jgi:hypothetical protein
MIIFLILDFYFERDSAGNACTIPCMTMDIAFGFTNYENVTSPNETQIIMNFNNHVTVMKSQYEFRQVQFPLILLLWFYK